MSNKLGMDQMIIGLDADDTLWHNERFFALTQERFCALLSSHGADSHLMERLHAAERRNHALYGYGVKGFVLSMIETAIEVTDGQVPSAVIAEFLHAGREMLNYPIELLDGVAETIPWLAERYRLILITKGDLIDQERKLAQSGLGDYFSGVEIVSEKTAQSYRDIFPRNGCDPTRAVMIGNSLKSDVIPALDAGSWGVHIPYDITAEFEKAAAPSGHPRFTELGNIAELPQFLVGIAAR